MKKNILGIKNIHPFQGRLVGKIQCSHGSARAQPWADLFIAIGEKILVGKIQCSHGSARAQPWADLFIAIGEIFNPNFYLLEKGSTSLRPFNPAHAWAKRHVYQKYICKEMA